MNQIISLSLFGFRTTLNSLNKSNQSLHRMGSFYFPRTPRLSSDAKITSSGDSYKRKPSNWSIAFGSPDSNSNQISNFIDFLSKPLGGDFFYGTLQA
ncbi:MAG: hypothetical protein KDD48_08460, partial [Bdellovibrionales bacterium]|nr:hypothetical protein [Bdellovibrionales bacterium]